MLDNDCILLYLWRSSLTKHSPGRLIAVSSSLLPGCSISEDGATLPNEQFEQILQPLGRRP